MSLISIRMVQKGFNGSKLPQKGFCPPLLEILVKASWKFELNGLQDDV